MPRQTGFAQGRIHTQRPPVLSVALSLSLAIAIAFSALLTFAPQTALAAPVANQGEHRTYVVKVGDTLSEIALRFGISQDLLQRANNIRNENVVYVGQVLTIPGNAGTPPEPTRPTTYVVKRGDTLALIAQRFNTTVLALMQANNIKNPNRIEVGDVLHLPTQGGKDPVGPVYPPAQPPVYNPPVQPPAHPPVVDHGKDPVGPPVYR
ncbi:MAG: LysM peptidoglycan-binding domain-containing protein, partial [Litorilinea sp.]